MSIEEAARKQVQERLDAARKRYEHTPWWLRSRWNGRLYRPLMRAMHWWGFCYPQPVFPDDDIVWWCSWCGLRGHK